jgi:hypothetical protein
MWPRPQYRVATAQNGLPSFLANSPSKIKQIQVRADFPPPESLEKSRDFVKE